jgi:hypothetical protein
VWGAGNEATVESPDLLQGTHAQAEAYSLLKRCDVSGLKREHGERGTRRMVWQAIEGNVRKKNANRA